MPREGFMKVRFKLTQEGLRENRQVNWKKQFFWKHPDIHGSMPKFKGQNSG